ncbi:MAG: ABC transporter permease subunit [Micrococcales bacterium]|nr:ABC transporter permease subunit [Micrococcales bacterium]
MTITDKLRTPTDGPPARRRRPPASTGVYVVKVVGLTLIAATLVSVLPTVVATGQWGFLAVFVAVAALLVAVYSTRRAVPAKYLVPGVTMLLLFLVYPIMLTFQLSTTNYGDGTRSSRSEAITRIVGTSAVQVPGGAVYSLVVGTQGTPTAGPFAFFLVDTQTDQVFRGTQTELTELGPSEVTVADGTVAAADGWTMLTRQQVNAISGADQPLDGFTVPAGDNAVIKVQGFQAITMRTPLVYDKKADTITNTDTGAVYHPERSSSGDRSFFVDADGNRLSNQSWGENVGAFNYERIFTDSRITGPFLSIFLWTVVFATASVGLTFFLGLGLAVVLNDPRLRFQRFYRSALVLPYAIPGFISLMVWSGFWNQRFGLVNQMLGLDVNWLGQTWSARVAVILTNLWMGFPYMFLVCTGALQSIPSELKEAAAIDGASGFTQFRKITFPLLLVSVAPLLVAAFAFNFNNFNAIQLLTRGGPFSSDNPTAGGTDILISYTYRLAFGTGGQQIGFASAVSVVLFVLTGAIAAVQFRATRFLEDVN